MEKKRSREDEIEVQAKEIIKEIVDRMEEIERETIHPAYKGAWDGMKEEFLGIVGVQTQQEETAEAVVEDDDEYNIDIQPPIPPERLSPPPRMPPARTGEVPRELPRRQTLPPLRQSPARRSMDDVDEEYESLLDKD